MTPAVIDRPRLSPSCPKSVEGNWDLCEYRDEVEPLALLEPTLGIWSTEPPSSWLADSWDFSLCILRPKNDRPPEDCLDLLSAAVVDGISPVHRHTFLR